MINPNIEDCRKKREVLYITKHNPPESGVVLGYNKHYVQVLFKGDIHPKACDREQLQWKPPTAPPPVKDEKAFDLELIKTAFTITSTGGMIGFRLGGVAFRTNKALNSLLSGALTISRTGVKSTPVIVIIYFEVLWFIKINKVLKFKRRRPKVTVMDEAGKYQPPTGKMNGCQAHADPEAEESKPGETVIKGEPPEKK